MHLCYGSWKLQEILHRIGENSKHHDTFPSESSCKRLVVCCLSGFILLFWFSLLIVKWHLALLCFFLKLHILQNVGSCLYLLNIAVIWVFIALNLCLEEAFNFSVWNNFLLRINYLYFMIDIDTARLPSMIDSIASFIVKI